MGRPRKNQLLCLLVIPDYQPGDPAPQGYLQKQAWAEVQMKAGLRARRCPTCKLWRFPQEGCCGNTTNRASLRKTQHDVE